MHVRVCMYVCVSRVGWTRVLVSVKLLGEFKPYVLYTHKSSLSLSLSTIVTIIQRWQIRKIIRYLFRSFAHWYDGLAACPLAESRSFLGMEIRCFPKGSRFCVCVCVYNVYMIAEDIYIHIYNTMYVRVYAYIPFYVHVIPFLDNTICIALPPIRVRASIWKLRVHSPIECGYQMIKMYRTLSRSPLIADVTWNHCSQWTRILTDTDIPRGRCTASPLI